jgi:glycerol-3-phosphate acyltransferase PlsY
VSSLAGAVLVPLAFLIGSFPSGVVVSRLMLGKDIRDLGSGNIGAANAARTGGMKAGVTVGLFDIVKGVVPVLIGRWLGVEPVLLALIAVAAVLGHDFSIFLRFKGGKGVATTLGAMVAIGPLGAVVAAVIWLAVLLTTWYSSLASLICLAALPVALALTRQDPATVIAAVFLFLLAAFKHRENIARLRAGTESSFRRRTANGD